MASIHPFIPITYLQPLPNCLGVAGLHRDGAIAMRRKFMRSLAIKICPSRLLLEIANHVSGVAS
jgi:hypothetical protein